MFVNKIKNFFISTPKYADDKDFEAYASITVSVNVLFFVEVLLHSIFLIGFTASELLDISVFEMIDLVLYAAGIILIKYKKGSWIPCVIYYVVETFAHQILCLLLFGKDTGFEYLLFPIIIIIMFIRYTNKAEEFVRNIVVILVCFTFLFFTILLRDYTPRHFLNEEFSNSLLIVNSLASFVIMALFVYKIFHSMDELRMKLKTRVDQKENEIGNLQNKIIISFADIIEARDGSTGQHVKRTSQYVEAIVYQLRRKEDFSDIITDQYTHDIILSAPLHDIGKITIPDAILKKPGRLTDEEFEIIKKHTVNGKQLLEKSMSDLEDGTFLSVAKNVAACHHECWNGSGYPYGLAGTEIPLEARIMSIADFFDAIVTKRCYKEAMSYDDAFDLIKNYRGKKFDPEVTDAFLEIRRQIEIIAKTNH